MRLRKLFEIGGIIAGVVLIAFGAVAIYMGVDGRATVRDSIKQEQITFGAADDPAVAKYASQWADGRLRPVPRRARSPRSSTSTRSRAPAA